MDVLRHRKDVQRYRQEVTAWQKRHDAHAPRVGDLAPDFELCDTLGCNPIRLSEFCGGLPVVLIFGSYS